MRAAHHFLACGFVAATLSALTFPGCGGGGGGGVSLSASFTESVSTLPPGFVKLRQKSASGGRVVIQAVIGGPETTLDMFAFAFDVKIGDGSVAKFVAKSGVAGNALVATAGQTIQALVDTASGDPTDIVVGVSKLGGPPGNGIAGSSATVVEMAFDLLQAGTTTLTITAPATCVDSQSPPQPIAEVTFDILASGSLNAVSTGGGGY